MLFLSGWKSFRNYLLHYPEAGRCVGQCGPFPELTPMFAHVGMPFLMAEFICGPCVSVNTKEFYRFLVVLPDVGAANRSYPTLETYI